MSDRPGVPDPERWARASLGILERHVDAGEIDEVVGILPADLETLWPAHAGTS